MALSKEVKQKLIKEFAITPQDTGSVEVQIALLTEKIGQLTEHCKSNPHDYSTRRGLLKMVCRRRRFLTYLAKHDVDKYHDVIKRLGLKK